MILKGFAVFSRIERVLYEDLRFKGESKGLKDVLEEFGGLNDKFGSWIDIPKSISRKHSATTKVIAQQEDFWRRNKIMVAAPK